MRRWLGRSLLGLPLLVHGCCVAQGPDAGADARLLEAARETLTSAPAPERATRGRGATEADPAPRLACIVPADLLPHPSWQRLGHEGSLVRYDPWPVDDPRGPSGRVTRTLWLLDRNGEASRFREQLVRVARDEAWGVAVRAQAVQALAPCSDRASEAALLALLRDGDVAPVACRMLGHRAISDAGWNELRSVVAAGDDGAGYGAWILQRDAFRCSRADFDVLIDSAVERGSKEALAALLACEARTGLVLPHVGATRPQAFLRPPMLALLAAAGRPPGRFRHVLQPLLGAEDRDVRHLAIQAFAATEGAAALPWLIAAAGGDAEVGDRCAAMLGLGRVGIADADLDALLAHVDAHATRSLRIAALVAFGAFGAKPATAELRRFVTPLVRDDDFWVRSNARAIVGS